MAISKKATAIIANDLDRLATLFENECNALGIPKKVAIDFAMRCDLLSDYLEKNASEEEANEEEANEEEEEDASDDKEAKKASLPEQDSAKDTENSVVEVQTEADESYMETLEEQTPLKELGDLVQSDSLENAAKLAQLVLRMQSEIRAAHNSTEVKVAEEANEEVEAEESEANEEKEADESADKKAAFTHGYDLNL